MQVKKFEAPTIQEALDHVKRELGPEAIILQTKKNRRGFGLLSKASVEVTAAISERSMEKKHYVDHRVTEYSKAAIAKLPAEKQLNLLNKYNDRRLERAAQVEDQVDVRGRAGRITATRYADIVDEGLETLDRAPVHSPVKRAVLPPPSPVVTAPSVNPLPNLQMKALEDELRQLRSIVQDLKNASEPKQGEGAYRLFDSISLDQPALQDLFERLVVSGVDRRYAYLLVKKCIFDLGADRCRDAEGLFEFIANELMDTVETRSFYKQFQDSSAELQQGPQVFSIVGPTGVGKTATLAKIAGSLKSKGLGRLGLISIDLSQGYSFDQLGTYAKALNLPFRSVSSAEELDAALYDFKNVSTVLIDTPGRSFQDTESLQSIHQILKSVDHLTVMLALSAAMKDSELYECMTRYMLFRPQGIVITKLDETRVFGSIYNVQQKSGLPLLLFSTGQKIPEDLEEATAERVVSLVLRI